MFDLEIIEYRSYAKKTLTNNFNFVNSLYVYIIQYRHKYFALKGPASTRPINCDVTAVRHIFVSEQNGNLLSHCRPAPGKTRNWQILRH